MLISSVGQVCCSIIGRSQLRIDRNSLVDYLGIPVQYFLGARCRRPVL